MAEEKGQMDEEKVQELTEHVRKLVAESRTIQIATVVMLNAWRLYYCSRAVLDNYVEEDESLATDEEREVVKNLIGNSMNTEAMAPYKVDELVACLSGICIPFLQAQEGNISEELDEEEGDEDDD